MDMESDSYNVSSRGRPQKLILGGVFSHSLILRRQSLQDVFPFRYVLLVSFQKKSRKITWEDLCICNRHSYLVIVMPFRYYCISIKIMLIKLNLTERPNYVLILTIEFYFYLCAVLIRAWSACPFIISPNFVGMERPNFYMHDDWNIFQCDALD